MLDLADKKLSLEISSKGTVIEIDGLLAILSPLLNGRNKSLLCSRSFRSDA